jgi:hypothetical protein
MPDKNEVIIFCKAICLTGGTCSNTARFGDYCGIHNRKLITKEQDQRSLKFKKQQIKSIEKTIKMDWEINRIDWETFIKDAEEKLNAINIT